MSVPREWLLGDFVSRNARKFPNKMAVVFRDKRLTHKEVNDRANAVANSLLNLGVEKGDRVALLAGNTFEYIEMYFGPAKAGAIFAPINTTMVARELEYVLKYLRPRVLILQQRFLDTIESIKAGLDIQTYVVMGPGAQGMESYDRLIQEGSRQEPAVELDGEDIALIIFTGGTTGMPRGAMHSHRGLICNAHTMAIEFKQASDDVEIHMTPMYHTAMASQTYSSTLMGNKHVILEGFEPVQVLEAIAREKVTIGFMVPTIINAILQVPDLEKYDLRSLRVILYGGAPMPIKLLEKALQTIGCGFLQLFGQTEGGPLIAVLPPEDHVIDGPPEKTKRSRASGRATVNYEIRVVGAQDRDVPLGEVGEIIGRSVSMTKGYWDRPEETAELLKNGWLHTGDLGYQDEDGYIYIVERKKDMIISGGKNIYSPEIEEVLYRHPAILEATVFGVPDDYWGEAVKACVALKPGQVLTEEEVIQFCKENLASYKKPKSVDFLKELPKSPQGKILKRVLREKYWAHMERKI